MACLRAEVVAEGGLLVAFGFGMGALGAVGGRVGDLEEALVVGHKSRPPAVDDEVQDRQAWLRKKASTAPCFAVL